MQMLNHEADKRPSAHLLLESNIIPFEQEEQFEQLLDRTLNSANNDLQSFYYRKTIAKLFQRKNNIARDATFDPDTQIDFNKVVQSKKLCFIFQKFLFLVSNISSRFKYLCQST